jgi:hypothetical protein
MKDLNTRVYQNLLVRRQSNRKNQSRELKVSHCGKFMNTLEILFFALLHNFNFDTLFNIKYHWLALIAAPQLGLCLRTGIMYEMP